MDKDTQEKMELVEELGLFIQERHKLPPLAARLYSILVLTSNDGYSFDEPEFIGRPKICGLLHQNREQKTLFQKCWKLCDKYVERTC